MNYLINTAQDPTEGFTAIDERSYQVTSVSDDPGFLSKPCQVQRLKSGSYLLSASNCTILNTTSSSPYTLFYVGGDGAAIENAGNGVFQSSFFSGCLVNLTSGIPEVASFQFDGNGGFGLSVIYLHSSLSYNDLVNHCAVSFCLHLIPS